VKNTCIHKQIDIAEHNEKKKKYIYIYIYRSLSRFIRVFHQNMTIEEKSISPSYFSFVINRGLNLAEVCQFKDLVTTEKLSSIALI